MLKIYFFIFLCSCFSIAKAQEEKNYIIEIDGDTVGASLGEKVNFKLKDGKTIGIRVVKKAVLTYQNELLSFSYPSSYSVTNKKLDTDIEQLVIVTATGHGIMIQLYGSINPETVVDFMLQEITEDDIAAGYKQTKTDAERKIEGGIILKGKKSVLKLDDDMEEFTVVANGKRRKGVVIIEMKNDLDDEEANKLFEIFWKTLKLKY
jgi:hypothetical protein